MAPVSVWRRVRSTRRARSETTFSERVSAQSSTGVSGFPAASRARRLCQKHENPTALKRGSSVSATSRLSSSSPSNTSSASISGLTVTPPSEVASGEYDFCQRKPRTGCAAESKATIRTEEVPTSIPRTFTRLTTSPGSDPTVSGRLVHEDDNSFHLLRPQYALKRWQD